jgi:hypothetical protein
MHGANGGPPTGTRNGNYRHGTRTKEAIQAVRLVNPDDRITHMLEAGEDPTIISERLTMKIYGMVRGDSTNFNRRLVYPRAVLA